MTLEQRKNNLMLVKALELTDKKLAEELLSSDELNDNDLSFLVQDGLISKTDLKLDNSVLMKGMLNMINRIDKKLNL